MQDARVLMFHSRPLLPVPYEDNGFATMLRGVLRCFYGKKTITNSSIQLTYLKNFCVAQRHIRFPVYIFMPTGLKNSCDCLKLRQN